MILNTSATACQILLFIGHGVLVGHILTSAKLQKNFESDKHRKFIGLASDLERTFAKKFYKLTKKGSEHNNKV